MPLITANMHNVASKILFNVKDAAINNINIVAILNSNIPMDLIIADVFIIIFSLSLR